MKTLSIMFGGTIALLSTIVPAQDHTLTADGSDVGKSDYILTPEGSYVSPPTVSPPTFDGPDIGEREHALTPEGSSVSPPTADGPDVDKGDHTLTPEGE